MTFFKRTLGPLLLMICCPILSILFWYTANALDGSFLLLFNLFQTYGILPTLISIWSPVFWGSMTSWGMLFVFCGLQLAFMKFLPGKSFDGPKTKTGFVPSYKENGFLALLLTVGLYCGGSFGLNLFSPTILYDHFGELISSLCWFSLLFCLFLYIKGRFFPSTADHSLTGNYLFDYYWGTELYPLFFGYNIKQFTNCRFGMMSWPLIVISFAATQSEIYGLSNTMIISCALQLIYVTKFFLWEKGYLRSLDIMHDRAGFYICWGCLVWVPAIYTSPAAYLVHHPIQLPLPFASFLFLIGACFIFINYLADRQRLLFRELQGNLAIWGKPPLFTRATYTTSTGESCSSLLLASGYWGIARHFHYVPEILGAFFWSLPALFSHIYPYFYVSFLTILLIHRAHRDDKRCGEKYGPSWEEHCQKVPYKIFPYLY